MSWSGASDERFSGRINPGTGSFYAVLAQAERKGLIRDRKAGAGRSAGAVYDLAPLGERVLAAEAERLATQLREVSPGPSLFPDKKRA